jgi:hypothetical protein
MKTICTIDAKNKKILLEGGYEPNRMIIDFIVAGKDGELVDFSGLQFGYQLQEIGGDVREGTWPSKGISFRHVAPELLTSADIDLSPGSSYKLLVWYSQKDYRTASIKFLNGQESLMLESLPKQKAV